MEEQSLNPSLTALSVSDGRQSENVEDFSLMSALLTPSDIMSTAEIKSTDSSKREANEAREPEATKPAFSEKAAKKKKSKKEAPVPVPIKVLKRDESQSASPVNADQISLSDDNEDNLDLENNDGEFLVNAGASSAAIIAAIRKQNALQNKMIEKALKEHRQYVDGQISRALNDVEKKSAANKKAMEASLQTAVKVLPTTWARERPVSRSNARLTSRKRQSEGLPSSPQSICWTATPSVMALKILRSLITASSGSPESASDLTLPSSSRAAISSTQRAASPSLSRAGNRPDPA